MDSTSVKKANELKRLELANRRRTERENNLRALRLVRDAQDASPSERLEAVRLIIQLEQAGA